MLLYRRTQKLVPLQAGETTSKPKGTIVRGGDAHATSVSSFVVTTDFSAILGHGVLGAKALRNGAAGWIPCGIFSFHHVKHSLIQTEFQKYLILDNTTVLLLLFIIYVFFLFLTDCDSARDRLWYQISFYGFFGCIRLLLYNIINNTLFTTTIRQYALLLTVNNNYNQIMCFDTL
jgi:hypothetical protein